MGQYNTGDTHFIISPRQSQISVLTGAHVAHKKSSTEGSWVGAGRVILQSLISCSFRALLSNNLPEVLPPPFCSPALPPPAPQRGGTSSHTWLLILSPRIPWRLVRRLREIPQGKDNCVPLLLKRLTNVNGAFLPWTCHGAHPAFFQSWHSYYRAAFLPEDQYKWFCWLRISYTQCWTALQCIWVWALHTLKTTVSSLRLLLFLQRSACSLISLLVCTRLLHWEKARLKSGCIILPRAFSSTTWGRMKKWKIYMNRTDCWIATVWSPTINNITVEAKLTLDQNCYTMKF